MGVEKSISGKYWSLHPYNENLASEISRFLKIDDFLAKLVSRNVSSITEAINFLDPKIKTLLPDPFHLKDMRKAVERTAKAIILKEKICIFADYDVDGATSSAILKNLIGDLGVNTNIYVPDRIIEGYGPTPAAMQKIREQGTKLVITVDCGSVAFDAIEYAAEIGLEVIVIDHHISLEVMPPAVAVINPNRMDETSEYKYLAAAGVSFLFAVGLCNYLKQINFFHKYGIVIPDLMKHLDLVALGTVCDVMQLIGLNRAFVAQGLKIAKLRKNIGYTALCDLAAIEESPDCYHLGFILGPRINAGGRVGKSDLGATLLSTKSITEAQTIASELDKYNEERKVIELNIIQEAEEIAERQRDLPMLYIVGNGWHPGIIGIVAGRLKEKFNKPTAVITLMDGFGKASCRSVRGIDFGYKILAARQKELIVSGGGHAMAAGFTVLESKLQELESFFQAEFGKNMENSTMHLHNRYELDLTTSAVNLNLIREISKLEPFGIGNPAPIFRFSNLYVLKADVVGIKHIKVIFSPIKDSYKSKPLAAIAFNSVGSEIGNILMSRKAHKLSVLGKLKVNLWQGIENIQLIIEDIII